MCNSTGLALCRGGFFKEYDVNIRSTKLRCYVILVCDSPRALCSRATRACVERIKDLSDRPHLVVKDSITFTPTFSSLQSLINYTHSLYHFTVFPSNLIKINGVMCFVLMFETFHCISTLQIHKSTVSVTKQLYGDTLRKMS